MAINQYALTILPAQCVSIADLPTVTELGREDYYFDDSIYWIKKAVGLDFFKGIEIFLPAIPSWDKQLFIYGDLQSTDLHILIENEIIISVSLRLDFCSDFAKIIKAFNKKFKNHNLMFLDTFYKPVDFTYDAISERILVSKQFKHLQDFYKK